MRKLVPFQQVNGFIFYMSNTVKLWVEMLQC